MRKRQYKTSEFICMECENVIPLPRLQSCQREKGHIKDLYCPCCRKIVKTLEIRCGDVYIKNNGNVVYV